MPETEGTQSGEGEKPIAPNRIDHLPGSSRDVQFPSLSRVASRIVKDKPRRTDSGRRVSPRSDAKAILDSLEYSDAAAIRYLETVKKAAEPWHVSLASAAFCALSWPHCPDKISELRESLEDARDNVRTMLGLGLIDTSHYCQNLTRSYWQQKSGESANFPSLWPDESTGLDGLTRHMTSDFEKLADDLLEKIRKINELDTDRAYNTLASLMKLENTKQLTRRVTTTLESAEGALALALGDYSTYSKLMWLDWKPQAESESESKVKSKSKSGSGLGSGSKSKLGSESKVEPKVASKPESGSERDDQSVSAESAEMSGALLAPPPTPAVDSTPSIPIWPGWVPNETSFLATESESDDESESKSESKSLLRSQSRSESESKSKSESELEPKVEPASKGKSKLESLFDWKPGSKSESKSTAEPESMLKSESKMTSKLELDLAEDEGFLASVLGGYSDSSKQMRRDFKPLEESFLDTEPEQGQEPESPGRQEGSSEPPKSESVVIRVYNDLPTGTAGIVKPGESSDSG
ncbi:hypothetical protein JCM24511_07918 [Saitozyma sp. JCM 24511]|nr:hypothetical protein JCM24511_07918 [Saitozyma sp. JCM 24511]